MIRGFSLWGNYLCAIIRACLGLTCAQQHFAFAQVFDGLGHFAQTLLGQVRRVSEDNVEAVRRHAVRKRQRLVVVVEHKVLSVGGEAAVVLQHHGRHPIWTVHHTLLQLLVHAGRAQACYPERKGGPKHKVLANQQNQTSILHGHRTQAYFYPVSLNEKQLMTSGQRVHVGVRGFTFLPLQPLVPPPRLTVLLSRRCTRTGSSAGGHAQTDICYRHSLFINSVTLLRFTDNELN